MAEHMRIGLLDPKWREQKDRLEAEMAKNAEAWRLGIKECFMVNFLSNLVLHRFAGRI